MPFIKGYKMSKEHKTRISNALKGNKNSLGIKRPPMAKTHRKKISKTLKGRHCSPATEFKKGHKRGNYKNGITVMFLYIAHITLVVEWEIMFGVRIL